MCIYSFIWRRVTPLYKAWLRLHVQFWSSIFKYNDLGLEWVQVSAAKIREEEDQKILNCLGSQKKDIEKAVKLSFLSKDQMLGMKWKSTAI